MSWILLYLAIHPTVQSKVRIEIDRVIGIERSPTLEDRSTMPCMEAVIQESLRLSTVIVFGGFHRAMEDVTLSGFHIPKDTLVLPNLYGVNHDVRIWGDDAEEFKPQRFLSPDETKIVKNDNLLTFSTGRRICIGEAFTRNQLFLFTTAVVQKFHIQPDPNAPVPTMQPNFGGIVAGPLPHKLIFKERF